jgi:hypothetical protein
MIPVAEIPDWIFNKENPAGLWVGGSVVDISHKRVSIEAVFFFQNVGFPNKKKRIPFANKRKIT